MECSEQEFSVDYTHHGPVVAKRGEYFVTITPLHQPDKEIEQYVRSMKANGLDQFTEYMRIRANSTNNTVYADFDGNIAYWNGNFVPVRNPEANYREPVLSNPENDWKGLHALEEIIHVINPENGWIQNCNSTPYLAAGEFSPKPGNYPAYMTGHHHNPRAANAIRLLDEAHDFTADDFRKLAYDNYLQLFDLVLPPLFKAWDTLGDVEQYEELADPVNLLRNWDRRATMTSQEVLLGEAYARQFSRLASRYVPADTVMGMNLESYPQVIIGIKKMSNEEILEALREAHASVVESYGRFDMPLGEVLRFQRISDHPTIYSDSEPSLPSRFVSGFLGSLPAAYYRSLEGSYRQYYAGGNSFIAVVDFGEQVEAWTIVGGGQSADPDSPHYTDQAEMFINGILKKVHFRKEDVEANKEREYHPGE
ncbi:MAG: penicillin acylase family protein [Cyclobacteriaceae bacterium]